MDSAIAFATPNVKDLNRELHKWAASGILFAFPIPPSLLAYRLMDNTFIPNARELVETLENNGDLIPKQFLDDHLAFYARIYAAALECCVGRHTGTDIRRLLLEFNLESLKEEDDFDTYLQDLDDAMIVAGIYL